MKKLTGERGILGEWFKKEKGVIENIYVIALSMKVSSMTVIDMWMCLTLSSTGMVKQRKCFSTI